MSLKAVDEIDDALERSKDVLLPFDFWTWTKLAVIVLFVGGAGFTGFFPNVPSSGFENQDTQFGPSTDPMTGMATAAPSVSDPVLAGVVVGVLSVVTIFLYLSSVFKFVLFRSLRDKEIAVRKNLSRYYIDGLKYLLFQAVYFLVFAGVVGAAVGSFFVNPILGVLALLISIPIGLVLAIFSGVVHDFAIQKMIEEENGLIKAIKVAVSDLTDDWGEFGGYLLFRFIVTIAIAFIMFPVGIFLAIVGIMSLLLAALFFAIFPPLGILVGIVMLLVMIALSAYIKVPFQVYLYSYFVELYDVFVD